MFNTILEDIRSLKIQGAQAVAREGVKSLKFVLEENEYDSISQLRTLLDKARKQIFETRSTEPALRNSINYVLFNSKGKDLDHYKISVIKHINEAVGNLKTANDRISLIGSHKIKNGMVVFTHCHSSTVMSILKKAYDDGIKFEVYNTETRPKFQGRITAKELADYGIKVTHFVDSAVRLALKKADLMLFGCDALTTEGKVINKIGTELFCEVARRYDTPAYSCTHSWKFDPLTMFGLDEEIEQRSLSEVWDINHGNITVKNPAFEIVKTNMISGVITEIGVFSPEILVEEMRKNKWMFEKF